MAQYLRILLMKTLNNTDKKIVFHLSPYLLMLLGDLIQESSNLTLVDITDE